MSEGKEDLISVIMPCYNSAEHIQSSISSVLSQTYNNLELIIVNDGSQDDSIERIKQFDDKRIIVISQDNQGVCVARNNAIIAAKGKFIAFLDADDTWHKDFIEKLYGELKHNDDIALAYCGWQNLGLEGGRGEPFIPPDYEVPDKAEILLGGCRWPIHAALTRKIAIDAVGGFDRRFITSEDYMLWLQIAVFNKIARVSEVLAYYHHHEGPQATKNKRLTAINRWLVQRTFIDEHQDLVKCIGRKRIRELIHGGLLDRGYGSYWGRDLDTARYIFRQVMKVGYGKFTDWKYMVPSLLPKYMHKQLIKLLENN